MLEKGGGVGVAAQGEEGKEETAELLLLLLSPLPPPFQEDDAVEGKLGEVDDARSFWMRS